MSAISLVAIDKTGRMMFPEHTTSIQQILNEVDREFGFYSPAIRYERVVVEGPRGSDPDGYYFVKERSTERFESVECPLTPHYSIAQIVAAAKTREHYDLAKIGIVVPYGYPAVLKLFIMR